MQIPKCFALILVLFSLQLTPERIHGQTQITPDSSHRSSYLHAGDVIRLIIWREPDLSGDFVVDDKGDVVLPKVGTRNVSSIPIDSLKTLLIRDYQKYLENPSISVQFLWRIKVVGAVLRPGVYPVETTTTITDAIAIAGGVSMVGRSDRVELVRKHVRRTISLNDVDPLIDSPVQSGDEIVVPQRGWLSRNPSIIPISISALASLLAILLR